MDWMTRFAGLAAILLLTFGPVGCSKDSQSQTAKDKDPAHVIPVEASQVEQGDVAALFNGTATLEAEAEAQVVAKVGGVVQRILVEEGHYVKAGQILARLDDERLTLQMAKAEADLRKLEEAFQRNQTLYDKRLISAEIYQQAKFNYESQKAAFNLARLDLDYATIRAPISGVVAERLIKVGNMVSLNQPVFRITGSDPLLAVLHVPEREIGKLRVAQRAVLTVDALSNTSFVGRIERISPVVNPATGTVKVTVTVPNAARQLKPGMFGRVNIVYDVHANALLVPKGAILEEDRESVVFVVEEGVAYRRVVQTGYNNATHIEVLSGLAPDDTVVTTGQGSLQDSARVELVNR